MSSLRERFTRWYYSKGYRMEYRDCTIGKPELEMVFRCPFWVRPFVHIFFSPCEYYRLSGCDFAKGFLEGFKGHI